MKLLSSLILCILLCGCKQPSNQQYIVKIVNPIGITIYNKKVNSRPSTLPIQNTIIIREESGIFCDELAITSNLNTVIIEPIN